MDISNVLKSMNEKLESMQKTIDSQYETICNLNRNAEKLNVELCKRNARIEELEERLAKYEKPDKNSGNSSTPPSKEKLKDEVIRRTKTLRKKSGLKPGGQKGHEGRTLMKTDSPDSIEDVAPNYCTSCGSPLDDCERILDYVTQVISLPEMKPVVKEIRHYITICKQCGARVQSHTARKRGSNAVVYDASVKSLVVYLSVVQFLPYGRIGDFLREVCSLSISEGSMVNWVNEAKENAKPAIDKIKSLIMKSRVVGFDESGCYCNKRLDWAWIAQTVYFTLLFRADGKLQGTHKPFRRQSRKDDCRHRPPQRLFSAALPQSSGMPGASAA